MVDSPPAPRVDSSRSWTYANGFQHWNRYAAVNDEFIDVHMSDEAARQAGQSAAIGMGNLRIAYHYAALEAWSEGAARVRSYQCRFTRVVEAADVLTVSGRATCTPDTGLVTVDLSTLTEAGVETTPATATLGLGYAAIPPPPLPSEQVRGEAGRFLDQLTLDLVGHRSGTVTSEPIDANDLRRWRRAAVWPQRPPGRLDRADPDPAVAPGDFNPFAWHPDRRMDDYPWMRGMGEEPGSRGLNGGQSTWHYRDLRVGDVVTSDVELVSAYEKEGREGPLLLLIDEDTWSVDGDPVRISRRTTIYY